MSNNDHMPGSCSCTSCSAWNDLLAKERQKVNFLREALQKIRREVPGEWAEIHDDIDDILLNLDKEP